MLYQLLTGETPFQGETEAAKMYAHVNKPVPPVGSRAPDLPPRLDQVIQRATSKRPEDRYLSAGDLGRAAQAVAEGRNPEALERSVAQDRAALGGSPVRRSAAATRRLGQRARRRPRVLVLGVAGVLLAASAGALSLSSGGKSPQRAALTSAPPTTSAVVTRIAVTGHPRDVVATDAAIWVAVDGGIMKLDPRRAAPSGTPAAIGGSPSGLAFDGRHVWAFRSRDAAVSAIDANDGKVLVPQLKVGRDPGAISAGEGAVWVINQGDNTVTRIDPRARTAGTQVLVDSAAPLPQQPAGIATGAGSVWVALDGSLIRYDLATNHVTNPINVGYLPSSVVVGAGGVWVTNYGDNTISRVDPSTNRVVATIAVGRKPTSVVVGAGSVWVANSGSGTVTRPSPETNQPSGSSIAVGGHPMRPSFHGRELWVADADGYLAMVRT